MAQRARGRLIAARRAGRPSSSAARAGQSGRRHEDGRQTTWGGREMAHVEKRGPGRWRARYVGPDGRERSRTFPRKIDAERWLAGVEVSKVRGEWTDPRLARITVADWSMQWLDGLAHLKPSTRATYETLLRVHVLPTWGQVPLAEIAHEDVRRGSPGSPRRAVGEHRPPDLPRPVADAQPRRPRSTAVAQPGGRDPAAASAGQGQAVPHARARNSRPRAPAGGWTNWCSRRREGRRCAHGTSGGVAGTARRPRRACRALSPHALRGTAASLAVAAGATVKDVQRMLGHASAAMTLDVYATLWEDGLDAVAERLDMAASASAADSATAWRRPEAGTEVVSITSHTSRNPA